MDSIIRWLESPEGEAWSRRVNGRRNAFMGCLLTVKETRFRGSEYKGEQWFVLLGKEGDSWNPASPFTWAHGESDSE